MNFHDHHPNQACLLLLLLRFFSSSPSMCSEASALIFCPKTTLPLPVYTLSPFSMVCKNLSGSLRSSKVSSYSFFFWWAFSICLCARLVDKKQEQENSSTGASVYMDLQQIANSSRHLFELCAGGEGHEAVAGGDSCRRATASSVSSALSSTSYNNNNNVRARSLARSRVGSTAGKCFPVMLGGGYLTVWITSGSGNSGTQPPRKKEPPDPFIKGPNLPSQRPAGSIGWKKTISKAKETPSSGYFKKSQRRVRFHERTGSFLGSSLFDLFEEIKTWEPWLHVRVRYGEFLISMGISQNPSMWIWYVCGYFDTRTATWWVFVVVVNTRPTLEREKGNKQGVNWCVWFFFFCKPMGLLDLMVWICFFFFCYLEWINIQCVIVIYK
jgi:hypothetical protein